jgi:hypothetical protein
MKPPFPGRVSHVRTSVHGQKTDSSNAFTPFPLILALRRSRARGYGSWGELLRSIVAVHSAPGRPQEASAFSSFSRL